jgi:peptidyl-prolyl cis-trans isomerase SurA
MRAGVWGRRATVSVACAALLGGCSWVKIPSWVPLVGSSPKSGDVAGPPEPVPASKLPDIEKVAGYKLLSTSDESVTDRVVAVVNNDAITLGELHENIIMYRQENREVSASDDTLAKQFLTRLIDSRLQVQEAEREKITVEEDEMNEELQERMKKLGASTMEQFEKIVKEQGLTMDALKKRLRNSLMAAKVVHRKVRLRVSVTERDIDRYLEENRPKLEVGLSYHARHILVQPDDPASEDSWAEARRRADGLRAQILEGGDFVELAKSFSRDTSAQEGGDLGTLKRGELAQDIETQILALRPGEVSAPYRSALGWHIFRLESKETLDGEGLVRARQQIRDILFRQKYEARQEAWLKEIKERAIIEVRM